MLQWTNIQEVHIHEALGFACVKVFCLLPCSAPIHMLPTRTLDQAHHCPKAAWDTPLPPNSHPSTPTRPTATEKKTRHHTHAQTHPRILTRTHNHRPRQPHLNECTEGCWDICNINNKSLSKIYQRALCCNALLGHSETVFFTLKHRRPSIGNTAFE